MYHRLNYSVKGAIKINNLVTTIKDSCHECYACVRNCPVKALRVQNGQSEVIEHRCIDCANCVTICSQGAKEVKHYKDHIGSLIQDEEIEIVAGLAPSFPAFDTKLTYEDWENILIKAGFKEVFEVAWGAQLMIKQYKEYLERDDEPVISSACPVVVNLVRKYYPDLVKYLAPIVSPMGALIKYLEATVQPETKIVLIGPCHAKKMEFNNDEHVEGVLTFTETFDLFDKHFDKYKNIQNNKKEDSQEIDKIIDSSSRQIPIAGGLKEALKGNTDDRYLKVEGGKKLNALFDMMSEGEIYPKFVDALFCDGCINGVDLTQKSHFKKEIAVNKFINDEKRVDKRKYSIPISNELNYNVTFEEDYQKLEEPSEEDIWNILEKTNKYSEDDLLNCGACGYDTCKEKAKAVYQGLAEVEMCLPYLLNEKRNEVQDIRDLNLELDSIINSSYDGMLVVDEDLKIERFNSSYLNMIDLKEEELLDMDVKTIEEQKIIYPSAALLAFKEKRNITIVQNAGDKRLLTTATPVFSEEKIVRVIVNARDIKDLDLAVDNDFSDSDEIKLSINKSDSKFDEMTHIVCKSEAMKRILKIAKKIANTNSTVLISGDSGVGKEVVARYIHQLNEERDNFVKINCGAIPERLLESELFGYETGAFSGARREGKPGLIEKANDGTLFLDEIGELPLNMQVKLLQVIQEHRVTRIGGVEQIEVDFRLITATNRDLKDMVKKGTFREDLFYRLNVIPITIPPLTERREDIWPLFEYYTEVFSNKYDKEVKFGPEVRDLLFTYEWPGNVREMINLLERLIVTSENTQIITRNKVEEHLNPKNQTDSDNDIIVKDIVPLKEAVSLVEKELLKLAREKNISTYEMADILGVNQSTIVRKLNKYFD